MVLVHSFEVGASATADVFPRRGERRQSRLCRSGRAWIKTGTAPAVERRCDEGSGLVGMCRNGRGFGSLTPVKNPNRRSPVARAEQERSKLSA